MTTSQIISRSRRLWSVDNSQYSDANALEDLNVVYHDLENDIVTKVRADFFWDFFKTDLVANQSEYVLPTLIWYWWTRFEKWDWVSVKYNNTDWWIKARRVNQNWLEKDDSYYIKNQSQADPFYFIKDDSLFLFPAPKTSEIASLKLEWIKWLEDLTLTSTESEVFNNKIPKKFHTIISMWMLEYIYQSRWMINKADNARIAYEWIRWDWWKKAKVIKQLQDRDYTPIAIEDPNLTNFS